MSRASLRCVMTVLCAVVLLLGPTLSFAAPMVGGAQSMSGKMTMSGDHDAKSGCMGCADQDKSTGMAIGDCAAMTCSALSMVLPTVTFIGVRQVEFVWQTPPTPEPPGVTVRVDPDPPKFSSLV
jgi:hypothetical protein